MVATRDWTKHPRGAFTLELQGVERYTGAWKCWPTPELSYDQLIKIVVDVVAAGKAAMCSLDYVAYPEGDELPVAMACRKGDVIELYEGLICTRCNCAVEEHPFYLATCGCRCEAGWVWPRVTTWAAEPQASSLPVTRVGRVT